MPILTDEELAQIEAELAARDEFSGPQLPPVNFMPPERIGPPPVILPPGPSPEFLRRSALMGRIEDEEMPLAPEGFGRGALRSFDPTTGRTEQFLAISPPVSRQQQQFEAMERLREQANTMRYKNELDAKNAAMTFMATQEYQNALSKGMPQQEALSTFGPMMFGRNMNILPGMMRETRPVPSPEVMDLGGRKVLRSGLRGERATLIPPATPPLPSQVQQIPVTKPDGSIDPDVFAVPNASGKGVTLHNRPKTASAAGITPNMRADLIQKEIETLEQDLDKADTFWGDSDEPIKENIRKEIKKRKDIIKSMAGTLDSETPAAVEPAPQDPKNRTKDKVYQTPRGPLKWTGTGWLKP